MWYLFACFAATGTAQCTAPKEMPSLEVCRNIGSAMYESMNEDYQRVLCVNGDTGERIKIKKPAN